MESVVSWIINPLVIGFLLDSVFGDPYFLPHPIKLFGKLIGIGERYLNKGKNKQLKGALLSFGLIMLIVSFLGLLFWWLKRFSTTTMVVESIFVFFGIANKSLVVECLKVEKALKTNGIKAGRKQLSMIVGRDTKNLNAHEIRIATLETLSENLSDGVIAPLFYYAIGGIPLMFAYKMVNTLDSMIGYKNDRFIDFGRVAAKTDDVFNYIPARLTAFLMAMLTLSARAFVFVFKFGNKHSSPNAGYPEAALAGILDCQFGGPNCYNGKIVDKPFIGKNKRAISGAELKKACMINIIVSASFVVLLLLIQQ
ncbi:MAG: adenosylcobinamide-phosphate synthase CbiB [Bacteroidales bacterium]|nr:adenosylcobinamide-phosphate synthase CbiB [Bacteroidales bacterium]